jgi:phage shock protein PspC (stress-responsive transcriptional regulator)
MVRSSGIDHDGGMSETQESPRPADPGDDFDPQRFRTIVDMKRSSDDRLLGGVCAGAARHLNIDPVIVRVIIAVLTFVGGAGVIVYAAAWLVLPTDDDDSLAARWFKLDKNEEQIRTIVLVGAAALAIISAVSSHGSIWWGLAWVIIPVAALYYLFVVRSRRWVRRPDDTDAEAFTDTTAGYSALGDEISADVTAKIDRKIAEKVRRAREPKSKALVLLTLSSIVIGLAITRICADLNDGAPWTTYVAVALGITAVGLLVGTFFGYGGPLIALGIVLGITLALGSALPSAQIGQEESAPLTSSAVQHEYKHGIGNLGLDLSRVDQPKDLLGRTIVLKSGIGQTVVTVPEGLNVKVVSHLRVGQILVFGRETNGTANHLSYPAAKPNDPVLTIKIDQSIGNIEVVHS